MNSYSENEIINMLRTLFDMEVSKRELLQCKPEFVQRIYSLFLKDFGANIEMLNNIPFEAGPDIQRFPEMYRSTCFVIYLAKCVKFYLNLIYKNDDFTVMDLFNPEWNRTKKFFSMFIEFYNHICDFLPHYTKVEEEVGNKVEEYVQTSENIEALKQKIRKREIENAEAEMRLEKEKKSLTIVKEEIEKAQEIKTRLKGRSEGLGAEIQNLITKTKEAELLILEGKERIEVLKSQVIDDLESLEVEEGKRKVMTHKEANDEIKMNIEEIKQSLKLQKEAEDVVNLLIQTLEEFKSELDKRNEMSNELKENEKEASLLLEKYNDASRSLQILCESVKTIQEERSQLQNLKGLRGPGLKEEILQLQQTLEDLKRNNEEHEIVEQDMDTEYKTITQELREVTRSRQHHHETLKSNLLKLKSVFGIFCENDLKKFQDAKYMVNWK